MYFDRLKKSIGDIIFETNTPASKGFDVVLLILIVLSIFLVILESVEAYAYQYASFFLISEWIITICFTIEYVLRVRVARKKMKYIYSFYGIIDFVSLLPTYLSLVFAGAQALAVMRAFRLLRVFRILKMTRYLGEAHTLLKSLRASMYKISVFLSCVLIVVIIIGSTMYLIEGKASGFDNIPVSIYRAIVTITTVGYGDISPMTPLGQFLASILMLIGYGIIAVPTGIVSADLARQGDKK